MQDDPEERAQEILLMGDIYTSSYLTVIAATGNNAHAGLPGISRKLRPVPQLAVNFHHLEAVEVLPGFTAMMTESIWNTRAWTYQERILSGRTLFFTDCQVIYHCDEGIQYEDMCGEHYLVEHDLAPFRTHSWAEWHPWLQFHARVQDYSTRKLTFDSDIFDAFTGVATAVYQHRVNHFFGLPESNFDEALLWQPRGPYQPRITAPGTVVPSWSWGSHTGQVKFSLSDYSNFAGSLIRFYVWSEQALSPIPLHPTPYWHAWWPLPGASESTSEYPHVRAIYLAMAWLEGCATSTSENNLTGEELKSLFHERVALQCGPVDDTKPLSESFGRLDPDGVKGFPLTAREAARTPGTLMFKAPVAEFLLYDFHAAHEPYGVFEAVTDSITVLTLVIPCHYLHAGLIEMDRAWAKRNLHTFSRRKFKFIALSIGRRGNDLWPVERRIALNLPMPKQPRPREKNTTQLQPFGNIGYTADKQNDTRYFDRLKKRMATPVVYVMLIEQSHDRETDVLVSRRVGVGWVFLGRWSEAKPQLQTIVLR